MNKLKYLREINNLTQEQICEKLFINQKTYSRYETGQSEPDFETIKKIAYFFNVTLDFILNMKESDLILIPREDFQKLSEASKIIERIEKSIEKANIKTGNVNGDIIIGSNITNVKKYIK